MEVLNRIEQAAACQVINLTDAEKNIYNDSGWKLARFDNGILVGLFDPTEDILMKATDQEAIDQAAEAAQAWLANAQGETWLVMCSCYQLCEPRRVALTGEHELALPAVMNRFAEQILETRYE